MSSTIIEAKFQALDHAMQLLQKSSSRSNSSSRQHPNRVTSPEQLRELVKNSRQSMKTRPSTAHCLPTSTTTTSTTAASTATFGRRKSNLINTRTSDSKSNNNQFTSPPISSLAHHPPRDLGDPLASTWSHQKSKRAHQLVEDTLAELQDVVDNVKLDDVGEDDTGTKSSRFHSSLLLSSRDKKPMKGVTFERPQVPTIFVQQQDKVQEPLIQIHAQTSRPSTEGTRVQQIPIAPSRCKSADLRTQPKTSSETTRPLRNWFVRASNDEQMVTSRKKKSLIQPSTTSSSSSTATTATSIVQHEESSKQKQAQEQEQEHQLYHDPRTWEEKISDPSFYLLEVRLEHPVALSGWKFQATFTDLTMPEQPNIVLSHLNVDSDKCLMFPRAQTSQVLTRFFNPFKYFKHVSHPKEFFGHTLRIQVVSISPVYRSIIDTYVNYWLEQETENEPQEQDPEQKLVSLVGKEDVHLEGEQKEQQEVGPQQQELLLDKERNELYIQVPPESFLDKCSLPLGSIDQKKWELQQMRANTKKRLLQEQKQLR